MTWTDLESVGFRLNVGGAYQEVAESLTWSDRKAVRDKLLASPTAETVRGLVRAELFGLFGDVDLRRVSDLLGKLEDTDSFGVLLGQLRCAQGRTDEALSAWREQASRGSDCAAVWLAVHAVRSGTDSEQVAQARLVLEANSATDGLAALYVGLDVEQEEPERAMKLFTLAGCLAEPGGWTNVAWMLRERGEEVLGERLSMLAAWHGCPAAQAECAARMIGNEPDPKAVPPLAWRYAVLSAVRGENTVVLAAVHALATERVEGGPEMAWRLCVEAESAGVEGASQLKELLEKRRQRFRPSWRWLAGLLPRG